VLQAFVLVKAFPRVKSQQGIYGSEVETTFGSEMDGRLIVKVTHVFGSLPWKLWLGGEHDYATSNPHQNPNRISSYDQQYPSSHNAFGLFDLFGFQNIRERRVNLDFAPTENLSLLFQGEAPGISSRFDNVYDRAAGVVVQTQPTALQPTILATALMRQQNMCSAITGS
jgi:hypothetical protein